MTSEELLIRGTKRRITYIKDQITGMIIWQAYNYHFECHCSWCDKLSSYFNLKSTKEALELGYELETKNEDKARSKSAIIMMNSDT